MDARERIEEAHGLWELAVARVAAIAEGITGNELLARAVERERAAFEVWRKVSAVATEREG